MKHSLITGAASGIGLALSLTCLQKGMKVLLVDKNKTKLIQEYNILKQQFPGQVFYFNCDITELSQVYALVSFTKKELGQLSWIFNNAGIIGPLGPLWDLEVEQINQVMKVNVNGMLHIIKAFMPLLFEQDFRSHLINMASLYALCSGSQMGPYSMSKHAILALSESLYFDLKRLDKPVDVSVVFPSFTNTSLLDTDKANPPSAFQSSLNSLLGHSRPALEVAEHIISEVEQKKGYIFPDKEVKNYCSERTEALLFQNPPYQNNIERLMSKLMRREQV